MAEDNKDLGELDAWLLSTPKDVHPEAYAYHCERLLNQDPPFVLMSTGKQLPGLPTSIQATIAILKDPKKCPPGGISKLNPQQGMRFLQRCVAKNDPSLTTGSNPAVEMFDSSPKFLQYMLRYAKTADGQAKCRSSFISKINPKREGMEIWHNAEGYEIFKYGDTMDLVLAGQPRQILVALENSPYFLAFIMDTEPAVLAHIKNLEKPTATELKHMLELSARIAVTEFGVKFSGSWFFPLTKPHPAIPRRITGRTAAVVQETAPRTPSKVRPAASAASTPTSAASVASAASAPPPSPALHPVLEQSLRHLMETSMWEREEHNRLKQAHQEKYYALDGRLKDGFSVVKEQQKILKAQSDNEYGSFRSMQEGNRKMLNYVIEAQAAKDAGTPYLDYCEEETVVSEAAYDDDDDDDVLESPAKVASIETDGDNAPPNRDSGAETAGCNKSFADCEEEMMESPMKMGAEEKTGSLKRKKTAATASAKRTKVATPKRSSGLPPKSPGLRNTPSPRAAAKKVSSTATKKSARKNVMPKIDENEESSVGCEVESPMVDGSPAASSISSSSSTRSLRSRRLSSRGRK
ncbi:expressed unknown protein [Seminavis robusta]|uniref:Uncharacterized protein n=1 Tax=Seminavis robusta TaxID=568900 RepID=A0A9N8ETC0_9STRA|nr:expressed unknown protein [Seminavis robusta]|eukprot:Sro1709_g292700.1 n/a (579) ;mRNA; r:13003-14896